MAGTTGVPSARKGFDGIQYCNLRKVRRLSCPQCGETFEMVAIRLTVFGSGREAFPLEAIVGKERLIRPRSPATLDIAMKS